MKTPSRMFLLSINLLPISLIAILGLDMIHAMVVPEEFRFGSDSMIGSGGYFYTSQAHYLSRSIFEILLITSLIISSLYAKWKLYYFILTTVLIMFLLPLLFDL
jgi:hypothetical protein